MLVQNFMLYESKPKFLCSTNPNLVHDFKVKITGDNRALSKILRSTIPVPVHGLKVKATDFEFFVLNFKCQVLRCLWLIWNMFGMNGYKILNCFRKEQHDFRRALLFGDRSYLRSDLRQSFRWPRFHLKLPINAKFCICIYINKV